MTNKIVTMKPSNIKTIDSALFSYFKKKQIFTNTNGGFEEVPVVWAGAERSFQIKQDTTIRDKDGVLILPQITVVRTSIQKSMEYDKKGKYVANLIKNQDVKGGVIEWTKKINTSVTSKYNKSTSIRKGPLNFKVKTQEKKTVYEHYSIPIPVYIWVEYKVLVRTEYQTQMNDILASMVTPLGGANYFLVEQDGWKYECFLEDDLAFENNSDDFQEEERLFKSEIKISVLGYIIGAGKNDPQPQKTIRENAVNVFIREEIL
jgi:hypothetical protein